MTKHWGKMTKGYGDQHHHHHHHSRKSEDTHDVSHPSREPSPVSAQMQSVGVSEGVDNLSRVSGSFMRSASTKNPLLIGDEQRGKHNNKDNKDDREDEPSAFYQRGNNLANEVERKQQVNNNPWKAFGSPLMRQKHKQKSVREQTNEQKRLSKISSAIRRVRKVREAASAAKGTRPKRGFAEGFRQVVHLQTLGEDFITSFNVKFRRVFEILRCVDPDEDNDTLSGYSLRHPKSPLYILWKRMINCLVMMVCFVLPALIAFNYSDMPALRYEEDMRVVKNLDLQKKEQLETSFDRFLLFVDICFCLDVVGNFFAPFFEEVELESILVDDPWVISYTYLTGWFLVDFLGSFPFDTALSPLVDADGVRFLELLGLFRLMRLYHVYTAWGFVERNPHVSVTKISFFKYSTILLLAGHWSGCLLWYLAKAEEFDETTWVYAVDPELRMQSVFKQYNTALYWALVTLTTVGYGDISPRNPTERSFTMVIMLVNMCISAYVIGTMTTLITKGDQKLARFRDNMSNLIRFMRRHEVPLHIQQHAMAHVHLSFRKAKEDDLDALQHCPEHLISHVHSAMYLNQLKDSRLLVGCSRDFMLGLMKLCEWEYFTPASLIMTRKYKSTRIFCIVEGEAIVLSDRFTVMKHVKEGEWIGIESFLINKEAHWSISSASLIKCIAIDCTNLQTLLSENLTDWSTVLYNMNNIISEIVEECLLLAEGGKDEEGYESAGSQSSSEDSRSSNAESHLSLRGRIGHYEQTTYARIVRSIKASLSIATSKLISEINTKLFSAARDGDIRSIKIMIATKEFDVNFQNPSDGRAILHVAAYYGHRNLCEFLLKAGANHALLDNLGFSAQGLAVISGHVDTLKLFARTGSLLAIGQPLGAKLCELVQNINYSVLQNFLSAGASPDERNTSNDTPLHVACRMGNSEAVQLLLRFGANVALKNRLGRTALNEATENNHHDIVKKIEDAQITRSGLNKSGFGESLGRTMYEREEESRVRSQIVIAKWWRGYTERIVHLNRLHRTSKTTSSGYD